MNPLCHSSLVPMNPISNDLHSQLNATEVLRIVRTKTLLEVQENCQGNPICDFRGG
ncbi:MAG: hypothetical protein HN548_00630 [Opitutae bacterium]|nr:hypothetical protein [Opitutae bacterium]MBT5715756.1 hypothetical protein [Opitutae bacterium]